MCLYYGSVIAVLALNVPKPWVDDFSRWDVFLDKHSLYLAVLLEYHPDRARLEECTVRTTPD